MIFGYKDLLQAQESLRPWIKRTSVIKSTVLEEMMGQEIFCKMECEQVTGSFKLRSAMLQLLSLNPLPRKVVSYTTGNYGIALSYACKILGVECRIYIPECASPTKIGLMRGYNPELIIVAKRQQAELLARADQATHYFLPPSGSNISLLGSATVCFEAFEQIGGPIDMVFVPCGGGGLLAGSVIAQRAHENNAQIFGCEPYQARDGFISWNQGEVAQWSNSPSTVADGLVALKVSSEAFCYVRQASSMLLATEGEINQSLELLRKATGAMIEPSAAVSLACARRWLRFSDRRRVLLIISGGNA